MKKDDKEKLEEQKPQETVEDSNEEDNEVPVNIKDTKEEKKEETEPSSEEKGNEYLLHLQRLQAEFTNYRNRIEKERIALYQLAKGDLVGKLLAVIDDLERMIEHHQEDKQCELEGIQLIYQKFKKTLMEEGLTEIQCEGQPFNPELHEAVGVVQTDKDNDGVVMQEWQKGYQFAEKMLRPSRVQVGKYIEEKSD